MRLQECVHVVGEMQVYEFQECRSIYEIPQLMTPSSQDPLWYTVLH